MTDDRSGPPDWERAVLEKVALKAIEEQRRARQWNALFKLLWFAFAFLVLGALLGWVGRPDKDVAVHERRQAHRGGRRRGRDRRRGQGLGRARHQGPEPRVQGQQHGRAWCFASTAPAAAPCRPATSTTRSGACAPSTPTIPAARRGAGPLRLGRLLHRGRRREDLRRQGEPRGLDRRDHGRLRLRRARIDKLGIERRAYTAGEQQGLPRSVRARESRSTASTRSRCSTRSTSSSSKVVRQGRGTRLKESARDLLRPRLDRREERRAGPRRRHGQHRVRRARGDQGREARRLHASRRTTSRRSPSAWARASARRSRAPRPRPRARSLEMR